MKKFIALGFLLFILGCAQINTVLTLAPYQSQTQKTINNASIIIGPVKDKRLNKNVIATITDSNARTSEYVTLQNDLSWWFKEALIKELNNIGIKVVEASQFEETPYVSVDISKASANISGYSKDNMKGVAEVFLTIQKGNTTYNKRVAQTQSEFAPIRTSGAFSPFVENMLKDIVQKSARQIALSL